jgi:hypothetical protein
MMLLDTNTGSAGTPRGYLAFLADNTLEFAFNSTGSSWDADLITTQVFRDSSSWYYVTVVIDTTQSTSSNRIKIYINGIQVTAFSTATYPTQNTNSPFNTTYAYYIGKAANNTSYFDGYMADINFIDGQALDPSYFGQISPITGVWSPAKYVGSYGTNGFYLKFTDTTSTTTLCADASGNSNNWTPNNISLTSGSTYDSMWDSPTSYNDGNNGVGNYCTWNPLSGTSGTTANGNLYFYGPGSYASKIGTLALPTSGKWYYEVTITVAPYTPRGSTTAYNWIGVAYTINFNVSTTPGVTNVNGVMLGDNGYINNFASASSDAGITFALNDVIGIAVDTGANTYAFYKNGSSVASGTINMTAGTSLSPMHLSYDASNGAMQANFGQRPFAYTPPSGFKSLCTQNLSTPSIVDGSKYMAATTYTGTGSSLSVTNSGAFQPDFVWIKSRSAATSHALYDVIRGTQNRLESNTTGAAVATDAGLTAFNGNGFTVNTLAQVNTNAATYVGWQWKAGGTAVTNTAGSITSSVSANTTAGFSVVTYTGNGTASTQTIGHGLSSTLSMLILKGRASSGDMNWGVSHTSIAAPNFLLLNSTGQADNYGPGQGQPSIGTGNTFKVLLGTTGTTNYNTNGATYVAYCFAAIPGYSAFGSYTGNGSTDGPFVYLGFRPRYVMFKPSSAVGEWRIYDTSRNTYNAANSQLYADLSNAEGTNAAYAIDILSNGIKLRGNGDPNASGVTYIYAAFAENPFKYSLAR